MRMRLFPNTVWMLFGVAVWMMLADTAPSRADDKVPGELDDTTVSTLLQTLTPNDESPWRTIPWKISLLDAQREASRSQRPIFIWAMDGHPLGCT